MVPPVTSNPGSAPGYSYFFKKTFANVETYLLVSVTPAPPLVVEQHKWKEIKLSFRINKLMPFYSMMNLRASRHPSIFYRPIQPSDLEVLVKIHGDLFPIRYEIEFFHNVVEGRDIVSWGAVDRNRSNGQSDELIGFVTAKIVMAKESEIEDMLRFDKSRSDQALVYILTLGVVESYRNFGIATSLIREVIKYSSSMPNCRAVYLHVISYNNPAIHLYQKMSFLCIRRLHAFYFINGQHYDAYLFIYYVNGGRSSCSPLELVTLLMTYMRRGLKLVSARVWSKGEKNGSNIETKTAFYQ